MTTFVKVVIGIILTIIILIVLVWIFIISVVGNAISSVGNAVENSIDEQTKETCTKQANHIWSNGSCIIDPNYKPP